MTGDRKKRNEDRARLMGLPSKKDAEAAVVLANVPAQVRSAISKSCTEKQLAEKKVQKSETKFEKFVAQTAQAAKSETGVEVLGGMAGQAWNEAANLGMRALGEWSEKVEGENGFWARNVDLAQSIPGAIGTFVFILEKALRDEYDPEDRNLPSDKRRPYQPTSWRRYVSEAAKIAGHLGFSNTVRALRFRWAESIDERQENRKAIADNKRALQAALDELEQTKAQLRAAQRGGG